eukprot:8445084-Alexandrium_andersonii.AAC.1
MPPLTSARAGGRRGLATAWAAGAHRRLAVREALGGPSEDRARGGLRCVRLRLQGCRGCFEDGA